MGYGEEIFQIGVYFSSNMKRGLALALSLSLSLSIKMSRLHRSPLPSLSPSHSRVMSRPNARLVAQSITTRTRLRRDTCFER